MSKFRLYLRLTWLFLISLVVPTTTMASRVEALLGELRSKPGVSGADEPQ